MEKEEIMFAAKMKVATDIEMEEKDSIEDQRRYEEKQRFLAQRVKELEAREAANNLKVCLMNTVKSHLMITSIFRLMHFDEHAFRLVFYVST